MPKKTLRQKELVREGFERREANRQQNQGSGSTQGQQQSQQSGAGHGNMSRDKSRDLTSIGPSLASKHGIHKHKNDSGMSSVNSMERRNWDGEMGLANTSYGHGPQNRIVTSTPTVKLEAETDRPDGNQIITTPQAALDTRQVIPTANASRPDYVAEARRERRRIEYESSLGKPRPNPLLKARGGLQSRVTNVTKVAEVLCAECGSTGHTMKDCITTVTGGIQGCIFCNNRSHVTDNCRQFTRLGLKDRVKVLVTDRAGMPPVFTDSAWWVHLYRFLTAPHTKGQTVPEKFPWRAEFALEIYNGIGKPKTVKEYQSDFDRAKSVSVLPRDWRMQSMNDVFTKFWDKEGRVWPARLDDLPSSTEANTEGTNSGQGTENAEATSREVQRLGEIIIGQAAEIHEWKKKYEELKKENEDLKRRLA
ncbi:hypothetical protein FMUND_13607 [Fusarium mundagurra]|uniref:CCHC-type domain-containing protein n=1 Tax=Fusarium mundagurra TaxID=1567541 RepID=A0A8H5XY38_9HYPO|nr:hypothetical protein FMUND_13607 [Fusarium mundagurra]